MKKALLVVFLDTHFTELRRVAQCLQDSGRYAPVFYFAREYATRPRDAAACLEQGFACFLQQGQFGVAMRRAGKRPAPAQKISWLRRIWRGFYPHLMNSLPWAWREYHQLRKRAVRLLSEQQIDLMVLAEENPGYATSLWVQAAHTVGAPVVVVPYSVADASEPAEAVFDRPLHQWRRWPNALAGRLYPHWVHVHRGRRLLRLPAGRALALEWLGAAPPRPWIMNSGAADALAVESAHMRQHYLRLGLPAEKMVETGALYDDTLAHVLSTAEERRSALYENLGLPAGRPMLLCALPPNPYPGQCGGFDSYSQLLHFWVETLAAQTGWNLVLRLHPRLRREEYGFLEEIGGRISDADTACLVPLCDLYVASVSATIRWAIACGKPVVNYDVYQFGYRDYEGLAGVCTVSEREAFVDIIQQLSGDRARLAQTAAAQRAVQAQWGRLDGGACGRLLALADKLTP